MIKTYIKNWSFLRLLRLGLGLLIVIQGVEAKEWFTLAMGALFVAMPLFNIGCCSTAGCSTLPAKNNSNNLEEISYEEVK